MSRLGLQNSSLKEKIAVLETDLKNERAEFNILQESRGQDLLRSDKKIGELQNQLDAACSDLDASKGKVDSLEEACIELKTENDSLKSDVDRLTSDKDRVSQLVSELRSNLSTSDQEKKELRIRHSIQEAELTAFRRDNSELGIRYAALDNQHKILK